MHSVPCRPQRPPRPDQGVVLDGLGEDQVTSGPQHPPGLGQDPIRFLEVVEHVDAPDQTDTAIGQRQAGAVGNGNGRLAQCLGRTVLVVLDADGPEAGRPHPAEPVAAAAPEVEDRPVLAVIPQVTLQPRVERLVDVGRRVLPGPGRKRRQGRPAASSSRTRAVASTIPARPAAPKTAPTHSAGPGSASAGSSGVRVVTGLSSVATQAAGGPRPGGGHSAGCAAAGDGVARMTSNAAAPRSRVVRMVITAQTILPGFRTVTRRSPTIASGREPLPHRSGRNDRCVSMAEGKREIR